MNGERLYVSFLRNRVPKRQPENATANERPTKLNAKGRLPAPADLCSGKCLLVTLIHFCIGSNKNDVFEKELPSCEFTLRFALNGNEIAAARNTSSQNKITLNGDEKTLKEYREFLEPKTFMIPEGASMSFRTLINRFIRPNSAAYVSFDGAVSGKAL